MEDEASIFTRPYRSKRNRPCDICRRRKAYCQIEETPPCQQCRKLKVACTFLDAPAKRQQTTSYQAGTFLPLATNESIDSQVDDGINAAFGFDDGGSYQLLQDSHFPDVRQTSGSTTRDSDFQGFPDSRVDRQQSTSSSDRVGSITSHGSAMTNLGGTSCNESGDLLYIDTCLETNNLNNPIQTSAFGNSRIRRGYAKGFETGVPSVICPIDGKVDAHALYLGFSGETDPYLLRHYRYDDHGDFRMFKLGFRQAANDLYNDIERDPSTVQSLGHHSFLDTTTQRVDDPTLRVPVPVHFMMAADELANDAKEDTVIRPQISPEAVRLELDQLIKPVDGVRLVGLFFNHVFPALPVASRYQFGISSSSPFPSALTIEKVPTHLLAAIYASSLAFFAYDDHLCVSNAYEKPPVNQLWRMVFEEIFREIHSPRLSVLQACLLYLQKPQSARNSATADTPFRWSFMACTVGLATSLGLHIDCIDWCIPAWEKRLRRRLWWAVYSEEKWRSLLQGQPTLIGKEQWDVDDLEDEDFIIEQDSQVNVDDPSILASPHARADSLHFRWLARLALIVEDVYRSFYTLRASRIMSKNVSLSLDAAQPLRRKLREWYVSLPESLRMEDQTGSTTRNTGLHSNASLHLAYFSLEILLYRALLRPLGRSTSLHTSHDDSTLYDYAQSNQNNPVGGRDEREEDSLEARFGMFQEAAEATISAAENCARLTTDFTAALSSRDFSGFWYSWSRIGFATMSNFVLLLLVQAPTTKHATDSKLIADNWRRTLRIQSKSCDQMNMGMLRLDAIYWSGMENIFIVEQYIRDVI